MTDKPVKFLGPHGVGDPNDHSLRFVERDVLISRLVGEKALQKCEEFNRQWTRCQQSYGFGAVFYCRQIGKEFKQCLVNWTHNPELVQECTEKYLEARADYRRTGVTKERIPKSKMKGDLAFH